MRGILGKLEENSVLVNVMYYCGILTILAAVGNMGAWTLVFAMIFSAAFTLDTVLCFRRVRGELESEDRAREELVNGVYRLARDHKIVQDGDRVIVYHTEEGL